MHATRREFLGGLAAAGFVAQRGPVFAAEEQAAADLSAARRQAAWRRRRVIYNNDGDDIWSVGAKTVDGFLAARHVPLLGTQVDSIWYCTTQSFNLFTHQTEVAELFVTNEGPFSGNNLSAFLASGTDGLRMSAEFAKKHGLESFWSLRMNDIHDVREPRFRPQWKREDPRRIVGDPRTVEGLYERQDLWTLVDYEHPDVAPRVLAVIEEVLRNYPIDGLELDFMRAPFYFRSHYLGQQVTDRQVEVLTELVAAVRALVLRESTRQRRPILMAARVPATVALGRRIGIDVQAWLQARLLDVLALSGGYVAFDHPVRELIELGHASDVPVYPCLSQSGLSDRPPRSLREEHQPTSFWKGAALRLWDEGADGMYTFNLFPDGSEQRRSYAIDVLSSIGSAEKLLDEERVFCISDAQTTLAPMVWSKDAEAYARALPDLAGDGQWATTPLATVGPLTIEGRPARLELRLDFGGLADGEDPPAITWNGRQLAAPLRTEDVAQVKRYCFALDPASSRTGDNELAVQTTRRNVQLLAAQLWILRPAEKG